MYKIYTGIKQYFTGKIVNYDDRCTGKYRVYFPSDGEVMYIYPDNENVFLTLLLGSEYLEVFVYVAIYPTTILLYPYINISTI